MNQGRVGRLKIWFNQHVLGFMRGAWWISLASMVLFNASPQSAKRMRCWWRELRGTGTGV